MKWFSIIIFIAFIGSFSKVFAQADDMQLAAQYAANGEQQKALEIYQKLYKQSNENYFAPYVKCLLSLKKFSEAENISQKMIRKHPDNSEYVITLGSIYTQNGNGDKAIEVYDNLIKSLRWVNSLGTDVGHNSEVDNLLAGTYQLYFTDYQGCESLYNTYTINAIPPLTIVAGSEQKHNDQCETGTGNITGVEVEGGLTPYTYTWTNAAGTIVSQTADLGNAIAGSYTLTVNDASGCGPQTADYTIQNNDESIAAPVLINLQLCSPGAALLQVNNPSASYSYRLYNSATASTPVDEQKSGVFKILADVNSNYFVSQYLGYCESERTQAHISVGITGLNIANTFTPNGDGVNDYWQIKNIENYPSALVQIFNRYGQKVFELKGYPTPFDGNYKGQALPAGVYYYIINLGIKCNVISGSLTIIR